MWCSSLSLFLCPYSYFVVKIFESILSNFISFIKQSIKKNVFFVFFFVIFCIFFVLFVFICMFFVLFVFGSLSSSHLVAESRTCLRK